MKKLPLLIPPQKTTFFLQFLLSTVANIRCFGDNSIIIFTYIVLFCTLCCFGNIAIFAQSSIFSVTPQTIEVSEGETFQVAYTLINEGMKDFQAPSFAEFDIVGGPNRRTQMQVINGRMSSRTSLSYHLSPKKAGQYTIPAATVITDKGQTLRSDKVSVKVSKGRGGNTQRQQPQNIPNMPQPSFPFRFPPFGQQQPLIPQQPQKNNSAAIDVFLRIVIDTPQVYIGQQLTASYRIYTNTDISDYSINTAPAFTGFWVEDLSKQTATRPHEEKLNGKTYTAYNLKQYALFPQQTGQLHLNPIQATVAIQIPDPQFGGLFYQTRSLELKSDSALVWVNELPSSNQPTDFSGAVGSLQLSANATQGLAKTGEPLTLEVVISGEGNIKLLEQPNINPPPAFEKYDPKISEEIFVENTKIKGRRIFEYTLIPTQVGTHNLPPITYSYFDLETKQYKKLSSQPFSFKVEQGNNQYTQHQANDNQLKEIDTPQHLFAQKNKWFLDSPIYVLLWLLPFVGLGWVYWQQQKKINNNDAQKKLLKYHEAGQIARKHLHIAQSLLSENSDKKMFYDELNRAIYLYLANKFGLKTTALNEDNIKTTLLQNGIETTTVKHILALLQQCQMALYAPVNEPTLAAEQTYQQAETLLAAIDKQLKDNEELRLKRKNIGAELPSRLQKAEDLLQNNDLRAFYDEIIRTLWSYVTDKFGLTPNNMEPQNIHNTLAKYNVTSTTANDFIAILQQCENALFAPPNMRNENEAQKLFAQIHEILQQIETESLH